MIKYFEKILKKLRGSESIQESELEGSVRAFFKKDIIEEEYIRKASEIEKRLQPMLDKYNERAKMDRPSAVMKGNFYNLTLYLIAKSPADHDITDITDYPAPALLKKVIKEAADVGVVIGARTGFLPSLAADIRDTVDSYVEQLEKEHFFE